MKALFGLLFGNATASGNEFHPTQKCPECGSRLMRKTSSGEAAAEFSCPNLDCPAQVRRNLVHWCSPEVMDIPGGDAELIAKLVSQGLARDVAELYRIKLAELAALPGMDQATAQKFFDGITASMKREGWRLLFGLNIPLLGADEAQALMKQFPTVDAVFAAGVPRLVTQAGVTEAVARSIGHWHSDSVNRKLVKRLEKFRLNFKTEAQP